MIRTSNVEYIELWREGRLDVDFVVSSEIETAHAYRASIGVPAARQTDVFADGQVQIVEYEIAGRLRTPRRGPAAARVRRIPATRACSSIIREDSMIIPRGDDAIRAGDRIVVIGSPEAAQAWGALLAPGEGVVEDVVVFGGGQVGTAIARSCSSRASACA